MITVDGVGADAWVAAGREPDDDRWREPLEVLVETANRHFNDSGRTQAQLTISGAMAAKLAVDSYTADHPEVLDSAVAAPIVITGLPRTGSTLLHRLLSRDPRIRAPRTWEMLLPIPPPTASGYETDDRAVLMDKMLAYANDASPDLRAKHELVASEPEECIAILGNDLRSAQWTNTFGEPYATWLHEQDLTESYAFHRRQLQVLQSEHPGRWVLKAPFHLVGLRWLLSTYPDVTVVHTRRNLTDVVPSFASLIQALGANWRDDWDDASVGDWVLDDLERYWATGGPVLEAMPHDQILDVDYAELVTDPLAIAAQIYEHADIELTSTAERSMRGYLDQRPTHHFGAHRYSLDQYGITKGQLVERFSTYPDEYLPD